MEYLEKKIREAITLKKSKILIYDLFASYEDMYEEVKKPTPEQQNQYIQLYFLYTGYMDRNDN